MSPAIRVALVDDHAVVRAGYRRLLELEGLAVVLEAADAESAYAALVGADPLPHVLVADLSMPGRSGLEFTRRACRRWPGLRVLVFSMHDDAATVAQCLRAGAAGFVTKASAPEVLVKAVRTVAAGGTALSPDVAAPPPAAPPHAALTVREYDVLAALLRGDAVATIASRLCLSPKTVANCQTTIRRKLGVDSAQELLAYALAHGLVTRAW